MVWFGLVWYSLDCFDINLCRGETKKYIRGGLIINMPWLKFISISKRKISKIIKKYKRKSKNLKKVNDNLKKIENR